MSKRELSDWHNGFAGLKTARKVEEYTYGLARLVRENLLFNYTCCLTSWLADNPFHKNHQGASLRILQHPLPQPRPVRLSRKRRSQGYSRQRCSAAVDVHQERRFRLECWVKDLEPWSVVLIDPSHNLCVYSKTKSSWVGKNSFCTAHKYQGVRVVMDFIEHKRYTGIGWPYQLKICVRLEVNGCSIVDREVGVLC